MSEVQFTKEAVIKYLDDNIDYWRKQKLESIERFDLDDEIMSTHYIDAYQSVRLSLFGELKS